jgi:ATP adenylyltransferase/5',5'''-P-1,P-4-tetraphosphate phosphorylase II
VNALGYIGMLYAKNPEQLKEITEKNPLEILNALAMPIVSSARQ